LPYLTAVPVPDPDKGPLLQRQALALPTVTAEAYAIASGKYDKRPQNVKANQTLGCARGLREAVFNGGSRYAATILPLF
jgi:hypothetical protein